MKIKNILNLLILNLIIIFTLLLIFIIYKSEIVFNGQLRNYYLPYYIVIFFTISISSFILFLKNIYKSYYVIIIYSLIFSLYFFEGFISYRLYKDDKNLKLEREKQYFINSKKKFDNRTPVEVLKKIFISNPSVALPLLPEFYSKKNNEIFPLGNVSNSETIFCNENGYYSIYLSDRYGFNNPDKEWDKPKIKFLLLGDSFVHGACVNRPNDVASHLRNISKDTVINLGYKGNGPLMQLAAYKEYSSNNIDNVIWFYFENDVWDLKRELDNKFLTKYLYTENFTQNLINKQNIIDFYLKNKIYKIANKKIKKRNSFSYELIRLVKFIKLENIRKIILEPKIQPEFFEILKLIQKLTKKNNTNIYFVYLPSYQNVKNNSYDKNFDKIKKKLIELEIPLINIKVELFDKLNEPINLFPFGFVGHYNEEGYKKVAETLNFLIEKKISSNEYP
tara:strand:+ start:155 stop:1501 length:1347 start_codon:yes stop_codon:yes gene_type:complete